jgi:hypothetical protein
MKGKKALIGTLVAASMLAATPVWASAPVVQHPQWFKPYESKVPHAPTKHSSRSVTKIPREIKEALEKVQKQLPELKDLHVRTVYLREATAYRPETWEFQLSSREKGSKYDSKGINAFVSINAETGLLYRYEYENEAWDGKGELTEKSAKEKADEFLKKILGSKKKDYTQTKVQLYKDDKDDEEEEEEVKRGLVIYERRVNGIPLKEFDLIVEVDAEGHVTGFENQAFASLEKVRFTHPSKALSQQKAEKSYLDLLTMSLIYLYDRENDRPVLAYEPDFYGPIDAVTGKRSPDLVYYQTQNPQTVSVDATGNRWVIRSRQDAEVLLQQVFKLPVQDLEFEDEFEDDEDGDSKTVWYSWETKRGVKPWGYVEIVVDKSGRLIEYYTSFDREEQVEQKVASDEAVQIAADVLEQFIPPSKKEIQLSYMHNPFANREVPDWVEEEDSEDRILDLRYSLYFHDLYHNIPVGYSSYSIDIDPETGKVLELRLSDKESLSNLPEPVDPVSPEKAEEALLRYQPLALAYLWPRYNQQKAPAPVLLYVPEEKPYAFIDAFSGSVIPVEDDEE